MTAQTEVAARIDQEVISRLEETFPEALVGEPVTYCCTFCGYLQEVVQGPPGLSPRMFWEHASAGCPGAVVRVRP